MVMERPDVATVIANVIVAGIANVGLVVANAASIVKLYDPAVVGVPESVPLGLRTNPGGRVLGPDVKVGTDHVRSESGGLVLAWKIRE